MSNYYFFETSNQLRGSEVKNTLRALPNQFDETGSPIDTTLNVQAPKAPCRNGGREEYPLGTIFCSTCIRLDTSRYTSFYTVYPEGKTASDDIEFHPVNPSNGYISPNHRDVNMEAAYALYQNGIPVSATVQTATEEPVIEAESETGVLPILAKDKDGKAVSVVDDKVTESYTGQFQKELELYGRWIKDIFAKMGIKLPTKVVTSSFSKTWENLMKMGETLDTITCRTRFEKFLLAKSRNYVDYKSIPTGGPHKEYISYLYDEHKNALPCTAEHRDSNNPVEVMDASRLVCIAHNSHHSRSCTSDSTKAIEAMEEAIEKGWTISEMINPERMQLVDNYPDYISSLADGSIQMPEREATNIPFIEKLMADPKNRRPDENSGFYVPEKTWKIIVRNDNRHTPTLLIGPSGSGKTEVIRRYCQQAGRKFTIIPMGTITDPTEQLVGKMDLENGSTTFDWADFALAIQEPGVILLDEINRIPKNGENMLFSLLDGTRQLSASIAKGTEKRVIDVHPDCTFVATANIGDAFTATKDIDAALLTRFFKVEMDYLPVEEEKKILMNRTGIEETDATVISMIAANLRAMERKGEIETTISTRETLSCATLVADGFPCQEALEYTFLPLFDMGEGEGDTNSARNLVRQTIASHFNNIA